MKLITHLLFLVAAVSLSAQSVSWNAGVTYSYDGSGNIKVIGSDVHRYDAFGRLVQSDVKGLRQSYTYDRHGNRLGCTLPNNGDCQFGLTVNSATNRLEQATYDNAGNATAFMSHTYTYDPVNMVKLDSYGSSSREFVYTADDERLGEHAITAGSWRWTVRDTGGKVLRELTSTDNTLLGPGSTDWQWSKDYVYRDGRLLASRHPATGGVATFHYHLDHLGTPRRVTTDADMIVGVHDYYAFGPETSGGTPESPTTRLKFTGHERDLASTGEGPDTLDYMHARYYSGVGGRFLSVDPVLDVKTALAAPQMWNRYAYVRNNPINKVDPTGRYEEDVHQQLTYALSRAAGFSPAQASAIAGADQGVDDNPATSPFKSTEVRAAYHFTTTQRRAQMWGAFEQTGSLTALGQFFHAQQDSYSHAGYGPQYGHGAAGHAPDKTHKDPAKALRMAFDTYNRLNQAADKLGISRKDRAAWEKIRGAVVTFNLAKTEKEKDAAMQKLISAIAAAR